MKVLTNFFKDLIDVFSLVSSFLKYIVLHKKFFIAPLVILLIIFGMLVFVMESSGIAPLVYTFI